ncbi:hypothetical protein J6590_070466 [Homalodisca vitripennis]|nr:hypothetical protein J6590_070466 [Homalodisca vitripennis]
MRVRSSAGLICFYCTIQPPPGRSNKTAQLCATFDYSSHYHVECPYSTFCLKRTFELSLLYGKKVKVSERGCAPQKRSEQVYSEETRSWHTEDKIETDVYRAGCAQDEGLGLRSPTEYCYCTTNLCNAAGSTAVNYMAAALSVIVSIIMYR